MSNLETHEREQAALTARYEKLSTLRQTAVDCEMSLDDAETKSEPEIYEFLVAGHFARGHLVAEEWMAGRNAAIAAEFEPGEFKIRIVFGEIAARRFADGERNEETLGDYGSVEEFTYCTKRELQAFIDGLDAMNGWMDYAIWSDEENVDDGAAED